MKIKINLCQKLFTENMKKDIETLGFKTRKAKKDELYPDQSVYYNYILDEENWYPTIEVSDNTEEFINFLKKYKVQLSDDRERFIIYCGGCWVL